MKEFHMSFKTWSAAQGKPVKKSADDMAKDAPVVAAPGATPEKTQEKSPVQAPPLRKS
jgi:hypothetical protein